MPLNFNLERGILSRDGSLYNTRGVPIITTSRWISFPLKLDPSTVYRGGSLTAIQTVQGEGFVHDIGVSNEAMVLLVRGSSGEVIGYFNLGEMAAMEAFDGSEAVKKHVVETIYQWEKDFS
jgi:hypothetical protein